MIFTQGSSTPFVDAAELQLPATVLATPKERYVTDPFNGISDDPSSTIAATGGSVDMDIVSTSQRSRMMSAIRGKDTTPELVVRSLAHGLGLRFRLYDSKLPGKPDLVFPRWKTVVLVHGCFWHRHGCQLTATPKSRVEFWQSKFTANQQRDKWVRSELERGGWKLLEVWECETRDTELVKRLLQTHFGI